MEPASHPLSPRRLLAALPASSPYLPIFFLLLLLACLPFLAGGILFHADTFYYFYPYRYTLFSGLHQQVIPFWEATALSGNPFCANPQANCFYPFSLWFLLPDFLTAYHLALLGHLVLGAGGTWIWLRSRGHSPLAAFLGALLMALSGPSLSMVNRLDKLQSLCYWPWVMWGLEGVLARKPRYFMVLVAALSLMLLAGGLEIWGMAVGACLLWAGWPERLGPTEGGKALLPGLARGMLLVLGALFACLLITAPQWLPLRELLSLSTRQEGLSAASAMALSLRLADLWSLLMPQLYFQAETLSFSPLPGVAGESRYFLGLYLGLFPLMAAIWALPELRQPGLQGATVRRSLLCVGLGLFFALGGRNPLYQWLFTHISALQSLRYPEKFLSLSAFFFIPLVAVGVDRVQRRPQTWRWSLWLGTVGALACWAMPGLLSRLLALLLASSVGGLAPAWEPRASEVLRQATLPLALLGLTGGLGWLWAQGRLPERTGILLALLVGLDVWLGTAPLNPALPRTILETPPPLATAMQKTAPGGKVHVLPLYSGKRLEIPPGLSPYQQYAWFWRLLYPNSGLLGGVAYADGSRAIRLDHPTRFFARLSGLPVARQLEVVAQTGVAAVVTQAAAAQQEPALGKLPLWGEDRPAGLELRGLPDRLPGARLVFAEQYFPDIPTLQRAWLEGRFDPAQTVGLVGAGAGLAQAVGAVGSRSAALKTEAAGARKTVQNLEVPQAGWLVLTDAWYPGWEAWVDGRPAPVLEVNGFQQGVKLAPGAREVRLEFRPRHRRLSWLLSLLGLGLTWLGIWGWESRRTSGLRSGQLGQ